jgi:DNA-binding transcriptional regulator YiaG
MGSFPVSIVPFQTEGLSAQCIWAPEPVFDLQESARILGIAKITLVKTVRRRFPEVKLEPKVVVKLTTTFGPSFSDYGEVRLKLDSTGGPQEHICLTHYGLFRHAVYIRTAQARRYVLAYPQIVAALVAGRLKAPSRIAPMYQAIIDGPRGTRDMMACELARQIGCGVRTIYNRLKKIREGHVTSEGLPVRRRKALQRKYPAQIRLLRARLGDSTDQFAKRVGVTAYSVRDWEKGTWGLRPSTLTKIIQACPTRDLRCLFI